MITGKVDVKALAEEVFRHTERVLGFKQLPGLYRVGDSFVSPVDAFAMLSKALLEGQTQIGAVEGRLAAVESSAKSAHHRIDRLEGVAHEEA